MLSTTNDTTFSIYIVESEIPYGKCEIISCKISTFKEYISNYENEDEISNTKAIIEIYFKKLEK